MTWPISRNPGGRWGWWWTLGLWLLPLAAQGQASSRTWFAMPTGNGHGFQVFDRQSNRVNLLLDHPYRFVAPGNDQRTSGVSRRDLLYDLYPGVRLYGRSAWLMKCGTQDCLDYESVEYEAESHVIHGSTRIREARIDTYFFAPFGYAGNALVMLVRIHNQGKERLDAAAFAKFNLKLGEGRPTPSDLGEQVEWHGEANPPYGIETGPGGGHALYLPIGATSQAGCGSDTSLYQQVLRSGEVGQASRCAGQDQVLAFRQDGAIPPGGSLWAGTALLFLDDNPNDSRAHLFRDGRSVQQILALWKAFAGEKDAPTLHQEALAEFERWRVAGAPDGLDGLEQRLWRQSEAVLRMAQVRERPGENDGMILASLPPGEWHTGWVRDAAYAIVALSRTGHRAEARLALQFHLGALAGFFSGPGLLGTDYRVSTCRYFGNGQEEGDFNQDGPNIETDGWGLLLWAARNYVEDSGDLAWLEEGTWRGDTVFAALQQIARDIERQMNGDLPGADASIWEVHWNRRQVFAYTAAAQARGLRDFADLAELSLRPELAARYRGLAGRMLNGALGSLVHSPTQSFASHQGVAGQDVHVDGSTVAFLDFGLVEPADLLYRGTVEQFQKLVTSSGGFRRLEPQLSLTGQGSAGTYDLSEWIFLDLRIGQALRRLGATERADWLLNRITQAAAANDFLIPELFDPQDGRYLGAVPMVGYGAGAWMVAQTEKHGARLPGHILISRAPNRSVR